MRESQCLVDTMMTKQEVKKARRNWSTSGIKILVQEDRAHLNIGSRLLVPKNQDSGLLNCREGFRRTHGSKA